MANEPRKSDPRREAPSPSVQLIKQVRTGTVRQIFRELKQLVAQLEAERESISKMRGDKNPLAPRNEPSIPQADQLTLPDIAARIQAVANRAKDSLSEDDVFELTAMASHIEAHVENLAQARAETVREIVGKLRERADSFKRLRSLVTGMVARELEKQADELEAGIQPSKPEEKGGAS